MPCSDAHAAQGGCEGGFLVPERQLCFPKVEAACHCACQGKVKTCETPPADPARPGPITPRYVCG
jgi:hypothetical protein